jgi:hypothetical protein
LTAQPATSSGVDGQEEQPWRHRQRSGQVPGVAHHEEGQHVVISMVSVTAMP